jgi:aspartate carbamoyltransferase catalytic subunit
MAAKMLSADTQSLAVATSSVAKGESFRDTLLTIEAMGIDLLVIRHAASGAPHQAAAWTGCHVINAGDGLHEHPTQGLLDLYTMRENKGELAGLEVALVGDLQHSRVARSNIWGLLEMGANVRAVAPATLIPTDLHADRLTFYDNLEDGVRGADVVNVLRIQRERMDSGYLPSLREYALRYQINKKTLSLAKPDALLMHPGPMNRGVEIAPDVADGTHSVIVEQVTNGVAIRMALLFLMLGGSYDEVAN